MQSSLQAESTTDAPEVQQTEPPSDAEEKQYFTCASCKFPILEESEIIEERAETWKQAVYPYELLLLDRECWCYSATNPGDVRFDVIRVLPTAAGVKLRSSPSPEHSWFPGYAWRMAHCDACNSHLGWGFVAPRQKQEDESPASASSAACCEVAENVSTQPDVSTQPQPSQEDDAETSDMDLEPDISDASVNSESAMDTAAQMPQWQDEPVFHGLILTKLRPASLTPREVSERREAHHTRRSAAGASGIRRRFAEDALALLGAGGVSRAAIARLSQIFAPSDGRDPDDVLLRHLEQQLWAHEEGNAHATAEEDVASEDGGDVQLNDASDNASSAASQGAGSDDVDLADDVVPAPPVPRSITSHFLQMLNRESGEGGDDQTAADDQTTTL